MTAPSEGAGRSLPHDHPRSWSNPPISAAARAGAQDANAAMTRYNRQDDSPDFTAENQRLANQKHFLQ